MVYGIVLPHLHRSSMGSCFPCAKGSTVPRCRSSTFDESTKEMRQACDDLPVCICINIYIYVNVCIYNVSILYISYNVHTRAHVNVHAISTFQMNWLHGMGRSIATFDYQRISICKSHQQSAFVSTVFLVGSRLKVRVACDASAKTGHPKTYRLIMSCWKVEYCIGFPDVFPSVPIILF